MASASAHNDPDAWTWVALEPEPTPREQALYDTFAFEYLVDYNATLAASRCGFQAAFAAEHGKLIYQKSYVQRKIAELRRTAVDAKLEKQFDGTNNKANLRSIGSDPLQKASARVAAIRELNAMHGLHAPTKVDINAGQGGAVLIPVMSLEDWEKAATASQQALVEKSKVT